MQQALAEIELEPSEVWKLLGEAPTIRSVSPIIRTPHYKNSSLPVGKTAHFKSPRYTHNRGESDKACEWLDRSYRQRDGGLTFLKIDPLLKSLRQDPQYIDLLKKMHFPA
jgi:hypothetical protein